MKKLAVVFTLFGVAIAAVSPAWAKPKNLITVKVVNIWVALSHSPAYHPAIPDMSTTVCTPNHEKCVTTTIPGRPASIDDLEYYSQFIYVLTPNGGHFMLRYLGDRVVYPPGPGEYTTEACGNDIYLLYVTYANGKYGKLKYRAEGVWQP